MKWINAVLVSFVVGCADFRVMDVEFVSSGVIWVNGKRFSLQSKEDGFIVRRQFPSTEKIFFRGVEKCRFGDIWKLLDYHSPMSDEDAVRIENVYCYYVILRDGRPQLIKWYGRELDISYRGVGFADKCCEVDCENFTGTFSPADVDNTYLHLRCDIEKTKGSVMLDIIEKYCAAGGANHDIYLLPY